MDIPHISPKPINKKERHNNDQNDAITLGTVRKFTTNRNAIAPKHIIMKEKLVHPYKLFNFTNEYDKDISKLYNDPCLNPNYFRSRNIKDRKYRGNQFGVRYFRNEIFNRPTYHMNYSNSRLNAKYPVVVKDDPWFKYNWSVNQGEVDSDVIKETNNYQDVTRNFFKSHPYFYYRAQNNTEFCEKPIVQLPHFLERFEVNGNKLFNYSWIIIVLLLVLLYVKLF